MRSAIIELRRITCSLGFLCILSLFGIGFLAGCDKSSSTQAPIASMPASRSPCATTAIYVAGTLSKADEDLFSAVVAGDASRIAQSVDAGANVNAIGSLRRTPLFAAAFCDRPDAATILIDKGSRVNEKDTNGMSALHAAIVVGGLDTAKVLISKGADIDVKDGAGHTPLHVAAATNQTPIVQMLLEKGANAMIRDKSGMTAVSVASENGHKAPGAAIKNWLEKQKTVR